LAQHRRGKWLPGHGLDTTGGICVLPADSRIDFIKSVVSPVGLWRWPAPGRHRLSSQRRLAAGRLNTAFLLGRASEVMKNPDA
jgi:hypothetical protein